MAETVEQYIARLTTLTLDRDPLDILADTPVSLRDLITGAAPAQLTWTTSETRWSIAQIAAHLADSEIVGAWRFRSVLAADGVALQAYDQNTWASAFQYQAADAAASVALFAALRNATLRIVRVVDPARLDHAGMHEERGRETMRHLIRLYAGHDLNHLAQIKRLLGEAKER